MQQFRHVRPMRARRKDDQVRQIGLNQYLFETAFPGQQIRKTGLRRKLQHFCDSCAYRVGVEQDSREMLFGGKGERQVDRAERLALARARTRHHDNPRRPVHRPGLSGNCQVAMMFRLTMRNSSTTRAVTVQGIMMPVRAR